MAGNFWLAFLMCTIAGLSTGIGSLAFLIGRGGKRFLAATLGFSAGVMIYVSFVEIFNKARQNLTLEQGEIRGEIITAISFFAGIAFVLLINLIFSIFQQMAQKIKTRHNANLISSGYNSTEDVKKLKNYEKSCEKSRGDKLLKSGILTAIAMAMHNFPEGMVTFISAYRDAGFAITVVVAIAIHNIPEGVAVSVPVFYSTKNKAKAFFISFATGLAELIGALIGFMLISAISATLYGVLFAAVAGMMVWISAFELLPSGREYSEKYCYIGFIVGMVVIAVSLLLFL